MTFVMKDDRGRIIGGRCDYCKLDASKSITAEIHTRDECRDRLVVRVKVLENAINDMCYRVGLK